MMEIRNLKRRCKVAETVDYFTAMDSVWNDSGRYQRPDWTSLKFVLRASPGLDYEDDIFLKKENGKLISYKPIPADYDAQWQPVKATEPIP
jgi:hypothetical protein